MKYYKRADRYKQANQKFEKMYEHVAVAEKALGRKLPPGAVIHHINEDKSDNRPSNLVICPSDAYHALIHLRMKALDAGFPANYRWCGKCKSFDDPSNMQWTYDKRRMRHKYCTNQVMIVFRGVKKHAYQWAADLGISKSAMSIRLKKYSLEKALTTPRMKP